MVGMLKGLGGMINNPMFMAGASVFQGGNPTQSMAQAQQSHAMAQRQEQEAAQREKWQQFSQSNAVPGNLKQLLPFMSPAQGAGMIANSRPKQPARPWWAGANGQVDPAMLAKTTAGRPNTSVTVNGPSTVQKTAQDKAVGKIYGEMLTAGIKGSMKARKEINSLRVLESALDDPNLHTGKFGETAHGIKKTIQSVLGINLAGTASGELVDNISKKFALSHKSDLPGPMSDSDRKFILTLPPGISKTPEGNRLIAKVGILQRQYTIARAQAAVAYAKGPGKGGMDLGFMDHLDKVEKEYAQKFASIIPKLRGMTEAPMRPMSTGMPPVSKLMEMYRLEK